MKSLAVMTGEKETLIKYEKVGQLESSSSCMLQTKDEGKKMFPFLRLKGGPIGIRTQSLFCYDMVKIRFGLHVAASCVHK